MRWLLVALAPALAGCGLVSGGTASGPLDDASTLPGLDAGGDGDGGAAIDDGGGSDGSPPLVTCDGGACGKPLPTGWGVVGFSPDPNLACPGGLVARRTVESPKANADACTCGCNLAQAPSCWAGKIDAYSGAAFCTFKTTLQNANAGQCNAESATLGNVARVDLLPPSGGQCTPQPQVKPSGYTATLGTVCAPTSCADDLCGVTGPQLRACAASPGIQPSCPPGFPERHVLGTGATVSCTACSCAVKADCAATLRVYPNPNCSGNGDAIPVGGACADISGLLTSFSSFKYEATASNARCEAGAVTANVALGGALTVCCSP
jgi:hypothetical protein